MYFVCCMAPVHVRDRKTQRIQVIQKDMYTYKSQKRDLYAIWEQSCVQIHRLKVMKRFQFQISCVGILYCVLCMVLAPSPHFIDFSSRKIDCSACVWTMRIVHGNKDLCILLMAFILQVLSNVADSACSIWFLAWVPSVIIPLTLINSMLFILLFVWSIYLGEGVDNSNIG